jgi:hypothetical protein
VTLVAVTAGAVVTVAAAFSGAGGCAASYPSAAAPGSPVDDVCYHLVRTMAERAGALTAVMTAIFALTVVGLSRVMSGSEEPSGSADRMA